MNGLAGVELSRVILGCMFSERLSEAEVTRILHAACDRGITSFDTAPLYGFHRSEELLGRALRDRRARVQLLTKCGLRWGKTTDDTHGRELFSFANEAGERVVVRKDSRPEVLRREVLESCKRLQTDSLDVVQIHHPDIDTKIEDSVEALLELQREGVLGAIGVSNYSAEQLARAQAHAGEGGIAFLQSEYSLLERWPETELLPLCVRTGTGFLAYSPLAKGVLADPSHKSARALRASRGSRYDDFLVRLPISFALRRLREMASRHAATTTQVSLAFLLAQPGVRGVVAGASSVAQIEDLAKAADLRLAADEVRALGDAFARVRPVLRIAQRARRAPVLGRVLAKASRALDKLER